MKKFELIKNYPSFKIPLIAEQLNTGTFQIKGRGCNEECYTIEYFEKFPEFWKEVKEPLFVTEDGAEVFELPKPMFIVEINNASSGYKSIKMHYSDSVSLKGRYLFFDNEDAVIKYIKENRPKFSEKQIWDAVLKEQSFFVDLLKKNGKYNLMDIGEAICALNGVIENLGIHKF